jgi:hypothetical protein
LKVTEEEYLTAIPSDRYARGQDYQVLAFRQTPLLRKNGGW